jgi:hypothetical protein
MFHTAEVDCKGANADKAQIHEMAEKLFTISFLLHLAVMEDVLRELSSLSL